MRSTVVQPIGYIHPLNWMSVVIDAFSTESQVGIDIFHFNHELSAQMLFIVEYTPMHVDNYKAPPTCM